MHAVANPQQTGLEPAIIHDRMTGYGIIDIHPAGRNITLNCWPRSVDPTAPGARQYPGWPLSLHQQDNYGRQAYGYLPNITVQNYTNPVFQVVHAASGEVLYTLRIQGNSFQPKVFAAGEYTVRIGEPDTGRWVTLDKLEPGAKKKKIKVRL